LVHANRKQLDPWLRFSQSPSQVQSPPTKHLIGVHTVPPRHARNRGTRHQCFFDDSPFLGDAPPLPRPSRRTFSIFKSDCSLLGNVHLSSKWTLVPSVHFARMNSYL